MPTKRAIFFLKYWSPVLVCMGIIFYAGSIPGRDIPPLFPYQDIVFHFVIYLLLALFFSRALSKTNKNLSIARIFIFTVVFALFYGTSDEFHQAFVPNRTVSAFDVIIDTLGALSGGMLSTWLL